MEDGSNTWEIRALTISLIVTIYYFLILRSLRRSSVIMTDETPPSDPSIMTSTAAQTLAHRAVRSVLAAMAASNHPIENVIRVLPDTAPTAATAAAQLGCEVGAIANSLIFEVKQADLSEPTPLLILTSGGHRVDTKVIANHLGVSNKAIKRASPELVKSATGMAIGGVAPVGHKSPVKTLVDEELRKYPEVWAAGGHHMTVFPLSFDVLVEVTGGQVIKVN